MWIIWVKKSYHKIEGNENGGDLNEVVVYKVGYLAVTGYVEIFSYCDIEEAGRMCNYLNGGNGFPFSSK